MESTRLSVLPGSPTTDRGDDLVSSLRDEEGEAQSAGGGCVTPRSDVTSMNGRLNWSVDDALNCIKWYCLRWRIEDWHRVLKSGCRVEDMAYKTANRLRRGIAINLVIAWRIMLMTLLGREAPALPAEVLFSDLEIKVLKAYAKKKTSVLPIV